MRAFFPLRVGKPTTLYQDDSLLMTDAFADQSAFADQISHPEERKKRI